MSLNADEKTYLKVKYIVIVCMENTLIELCKNGELDNATKLYQLSIDIKKPIKFYVDFERIFKESCINGHYEVAKWLYQNDYFMNIEYIFKWCCENNHLVVAKWLYNIGIETGKPIDIHANNEYLFRSCCVTSNLDVVKWLYDIGIETKKPIDFHINEEEAFKNSCINDNLEVAKWLYQLGINTDINIDDIFKKYYEQQRFRSESMVEFLLKISIDLNSHIDLNYGYSNYFEKACYDGELDLAKMIYNYSNVINKDMICCFDERIDDRSVARWLGNIGYYNYYYDDYGSEPDTDSDSD